MATSGINVSRPAPVPEEESMRFSDRLLLLSVDLSCAFDRAAMSIAYGEEAAVHYGDAYTWRCALGNWISGFGEGFSMSRRARK